MPARVLPTFTEAQTRSVAASAVRDGIHELVVGPGGAFVHERREAADEIDAHLLAGAGPWPRRRV